jgi:Glycosyltransferase family 10 (fucosyltransferase).
MKQNALKTEYSCRVVSQQFKVDLWNDFRLGAILYSPRVPLKEADALLVLYDPSDELLRFEGPKLWFTIEPSWHHHFHSHPVGKKLVQDLDATERAFYGHPETKYRVPHPTYRGTLSRPRLLSVKRAAVANVTNFGGRLWFLKSHMWARNRMILDERVELFGNPAAWAQFRHFPKLWIRRPPDNYTGHTSPGADIYDDEHVRFLSAYKVAVCLENCIEAYYFTEKFVNAVRAGCVPVYHAHAAVKTSFLSGARWIDPADFGFSPRRTIEFALNQDQAEFRCINDAWLESGILADTDELNVIPKLHEIISAKLKARNCKSSQGAKSGLSF